MIYIFWLYTENVRIGSILLGFCHGQVPAVNHKDLQLAQLLDVVDRHLHGALHLHVPELPVVNTGHATADLPSRRTHSCVTTGHIVVLLQAT